MKELGIFLVIMGTFSVGFLLGVTFIFATLRRQIKILKDIKKQILGNSDVTAIKKLFRIN